MKKENKVLFLKNEIEKILDARYQIYAIVDGGRYESKSSCPGPSYSCSYPIYGWELEIVNDGTKIKTTNGVKFYTEKNGVWHDGYSCENYSYDFEYDDAIWKDVVKTMQDLMITHIKLCCFDGHEKAPYSKETVAKKCNKIDDDFYYSIDNNLNEGTLYLFTQKDDTARNVDSNIEKKDCETSYSSQIVDLGWC